MKPAEGLELLTPNPAVATCKKRHAPSKLLEAVLCGTRATKQNLLLINNNLQQQSHNLPFQQPCISFHRPAIMTISTASSSSSGGSISIKNVPMVTKRASADLKMWKAKLLEKYQAFKQQQEQAEEAAKQQQQQEQEPTQEQQQQQEPKPVVAQEEARPHRAVSPIGPLVMPQAPGTLKHGAQCSGILQIQYPKTWGPPSLTQQASKNSSTASSSTTCSSFTKKTLVSSTTTSQPISPVASPSLVPLEDIPTDRIMELFQESSSSSDDNNDDDADSIDMNQVFTY